MNINELKVLDIVTVIGHGIDITKDAEEYEDLLPIGTKLVVVDVDRFLCSEAHNPDCHCPIGYMDIELRTLDTNERVSGCIHILGDEHGNPLTIIPLYDLFDI